MATETFRNSEHGWSEATYQQLYPGNITSTDEFPTARGESNNLRNYGMCRSRIRRRTAEGLGIGGTVGAVSGAIVGGLAAASTALTLPGIHLVIAGPLAGLLTGGGMGGVVGGFLGAYIGWNNFQMVSTAR